MLYLHSTYPHLRYIYIYIYIYVCMYNTHTHSWPAVSQTTVSKCHITEGCPILFSFHRSRKNLIRNSVGITRLYESFIKYSGNAENSVKMSEKYEPNGRSNSGKGVTSLKKTRIVTPSNHMVSVVSRMTNSESANDTRFTHTAVEKVLRKFNRSSLPQWTFLNSRTAHRRADINASRRPMTPPPPGSAVRSPAIKILPVE
jgi:hypothetical protein